MLYHQMTKTKQRLQLKLTLRQTFIALSLFIFLASLALIYLNFWTPKTTYASPPTETLSAGAFIINMGVTPQTYNNGLKPYGMIYDLIINYKIPVKWVINPSKARDGVDFTYNSVNYSGGPFIIEFENISSTIASRITYWQGQGVSGVYTTSAISVPVYNTLTVFPTVMIDNLAGKQSIITGYYSNAAIPATAYNFGDPSILTGCIDIWTNPHADPTWATHSGLYNFVTVYKSWIWAECHSVSVMESCKESVSPFRQLNFLTSSGLQCYSSGKCGAVAETHGGGETSPYFYYYPTDPVMQFMSDMHQAATGGSEDWYIPLTTGQWNSNTKQLVNTSDGSGQRKGVKMVYGPAFNNPSNGYVMYEGGHDIDGNGTTAQKVSAQRAYFNFLLVAGLNKQVKVTSTVPPSAYANEVVSVSAVGSSGTGPYNYKWTSLLGGTFASSTSATTTYKAPNVSSAQNDIITTTITDGCNRANFVKKPISILSTLPIKLSAFKAYATSNGVKVDWATVSEINNEKFTILRSQDGTDFTEVGIVRGSGNSTVMHSYSFTDKNPLSGTSYYRLKQTDFDGNSESFDPVAVTLKETANQPIVLHIYPNPFSDSFTAEFESADTKDGFAQLYGINGKIIFSEPFRIAEGKNSYHFSAKENMNNGIYIFKLLTGTTVLAEAKLYCKKN